MPTYELAFLPSALKEWKKLGATTREQLKKKLEERLDKPDVPASALRGLPGHYKIKLRASGFRLVYRIEKGALVVSVVSVGKRDRGEVYIKTKARRG